MNNINNISGGFKRWNIKKTGGARRRDFIKHKEGVVCAESLISASNHCIKALSNSVEKDSTIS